MLRVSETFLFRKYTSIALQQSRHKRSGSDDGKYLKTISLILWIFSVFRGSLFPTPLTFRPSNSLGKKKWCSKCTAKSFSEFDRDRNMKIIESFSRQLEDSWMTGVGSSASSWKLNSAFDGRTDGSEGLLRTVIRASRCSSVRSCNSIHCFCCSDICFR